jgi:hypothetical protein
MMVGWDMIVMAFGLSLSAWLPFHLSVVSEAVRLSRGLARDVDPDLPDHETLALSSLGDCRLEGFLCSILSGVVAMVVSSGHMKPVDSLWSKSQGHHQRLDFA